MLRGKKKIIEKGILLLLFSLVKRVLTRVLNVASSAKWQHTGDSRFWCDGIRAAGVSPLALPTIQLYCASFFFLLFYFFFNLI